MKDKYYNNRKLIMSIMYILLGAVVWFLALTQRIYEIWGGIGGGLLGVGMLQLLWNLRYRRNPEFRRKIDIEAGDERNRYLRQKAWAWAGYLFILGSAIVSFGLMLTGHGDTGRIISYCMCAVLVLYYVSYLVLQRKY